MTGTSKTFSHLKLQNYLGLGLNINLFTMSTSPYQASPILFASHPLVFTYQYFFKNNFWYSGLQYCCSWSFRITLAYLAAHLPLVHASIIDDNILRNHLSHKWQKCLPFGGSIIFYSLYIFYWSTHPSLDWLIHHRIHHCITIAFTF